MNLPREPFCSIAPSLNYEAFKKLEVLQNLVFLIEHQADSPEDVLEHVKTMQDALDYLSQMFLSSAGNLRPDPGSTCIRFLTDESAGHHLE